MRILYVLYFTSITYLLAATITESQGRWTSLYDSILTLVCYVRSATSAILLRYSFAIVTNLPSVENSLSSVRGVDVCRVSAFGTDSTCHPLDVSITPTPTLVFNTPTTRTVSAIAASPIAYNPIPYKDMYSTQLEIKTGLRKSKERRSKNGGIPSNVETTSFLDSLSTAASTIIIVQLLMALSQPVVRYLESSVPTSPIPNDIQFGPRAAFPGCHHALILSWISTTSSLILVNPVSCIPDDQSILVDLPLWLLYFTMVLVQSYPEFTVNYPPSLTKTRSARQHPLMIEAPTSCEVVEVLSFHWFQPHSRLVLSSGMGEGPIVKLPELEGKGKFNLLPPTLEIKPAVRSQAPDVVHPLMLTTTNSLHLVDYISESWSEVTDADSSLGFNPETSSIKADSSHPDLLEVFKPTLIRPFERISGRRSTPPIQFECDKASSAGETRLPLSSTMFSAEYPLDEYDFDLLSEFPAPPRKSPVRPFSFLRKVGIGGPFSRPSISPILDRTPGLKERRARLVRIRKSHNSLSKNAHLASSAHNAKRDSSIYSKPASQRSPSTTSVGMGRGDSSSSLSPRSSLVPSTISRWRFLTKKGKQKEKSKKVSSSLIISSTSPATLHEKVNAFPKSLSHRAFGNGQRLAKPLRVLFCGKDNT